MEGFFKFLGLGKNEPQLGSPDLPATQNIDQNQPPAPEIPKPFDYLEFFNAVTLASGHYFEQPTRHTPPSPETAFQNLTGTELKYPPSFLPPPAPRLNPAQNLQYQLPPANLGILVTP